MNPNSIPTSQLLDALQASRLFHSPRPRSRTLLRKVPRGANGIEGRHLALNPLAERLGLSPDTLQARFTRPAPALATQAAERALAEAGCAARDIDALVISTCTGYLCPGLTSYVTELLGLRFGVFTLDLVRQGCGAALPNWRAAEALAGGGAGRVLSVCVEVCSATTAT